MSAATTLPAAPPLSIVDDPFEQGRYTRWVTGAGGERLGESSLQLSGLVCAACAGLIDDALGDVDGVRSVQVGAVSQRATVRWDPARTRPSSLIEAVRAAGYDAVPDAAAPARALRRREHRQALWRLFVAGLCAMQVMMLATPSYFAGPGDIAPDLARLLAWGSWLLTLPVLLFSAGPFFGGAWRALRLRRIGMEVPVALGIAITFIASSGAAVDPAGLFGNEVYFDSLTMFVAFLLGARYLELLARHRAAAALEAALACLPETAWRVADDGQVEAVSVHRLRPGDLVRVPLGQAFPADGVLHGGATSADESLLTGESHPVAKTDGDPVVAGSVNRGAPVAMCVQRVGADTRFEALVSMRRSAGSQRPAAARLADRWAAPFLWCVLLLAAAAAAVWSVIDPARAIWVAVSVLIVTCPCALSLAAPVALLAAAGELARQGVLVQRLDALEVLTRARDWVFDKTGTLTEDRLGLAQSVSLSVAAAEPALGWTAFAASLAAHSGHPLSRALRQAVAGCAAASTDAPLWQAVHEVPGLGLEAVCATAGQPSQVWRLGSAAWCGVAHTGSPTASPRPVVWLACEGTAGWQPQARFEFDETLRADAAAALQALREAGLSLHLLSGDQPRSVATIAARLGLEGKGRVQARCTPQDKLAAVQALQESGHTVVMVGDGINDAPVLARADVSVALGSAAALAQAKADVIVLGNRLGDLVLLHHMAGRTLRIVRQNLVWAVAYNLASVPLALAGWLPPWLAGIGMAASSLGVVLNSLRLTRRPIERGALATARTGEGPPLARPV
ncbi:MAG: cation-translocating P-type ATPase [Burkholderiales bacterium]